MTEEVLVSVTGLHALDDEQEDEIEVTSAGKYYQKNGKHYILYEEVVDDSGTTMKSRVTLRGGRMEVTKSGAASSKMIFERGCKNTSWYSTPFGNLLAGIEVKEMQVTEQEDLLEIAVDYRLEINYEEVADSRIRIRVMSKDSGLFRLK